jgi:hypothetical protein
VAQGQQQAQESEVHNAMVADEISMAQEIAEKMTLTEMAEHVLWGSLRALEVQGG